LQQKVGWTRFEIEIRLKHGYQPDPRTHVAGWRLRKETKSIPKQPHYFMLSRALKQYNFSSFFSHEKGYLRNFFLKKLKRYSFR
jgi:hypothetical protein